MKTSIVAVQIAELISIPEARLLFGEQIVFTDRDELFCRLNGEQFLAVFNYGVVGFFNFEKMEIKSYIEKLRSVSKNLISDCEGHSEAFQVEEGKDFKTGFDSITLPSGNTNMLRLVMLNIAQSVALDHYAKLTESLLEDTRIHTNYLENRGALDIKGKKLKRYIGSALNIKNKISEHLYIFDSPEAAWDDQELNKVNASMKQMLELQERYQIVSNQLGIVKDNLELFKDITFHKESSKLEWIIILLILIEVIDMFILKML